MVEGVKEKQSIVCPTSIVSSELGLGAKAKGREGGGVRSLG